jgi:hypothetical protein
MSLRIRLAVTLLLTLGLFVSCKKQEELTLAEAAEALEEAKLSTQAEMLVGDTIEITTNFTIGDAVEQAAQELRDFIASQLPCAQLTLQGNTLTVEYGALPGNCTYNGHTFSGTHAITVTRNDTGDVQVDHVWTDLSNGIVSVSGTANVTWSFAQGSRHVVHSLDWTRLLDDKSAHGAGDRTQTLLPGGLSEGIQIDGARAWTADSGQWELGIDGVQVRWIDPVPQAGSYVLLTPKDKTLSMRFKRKDADTITVTITSGYKSFDIDVTSAG